MSHVAVQVIDGKRIYFILADVSASWSFVYGELSRLTGRPENMIRVSRGAMISEGPLPPEAPIVTSGGDGSENTTVLLLTQSGTQGSWRPVTQEPFPAAAHGVMPKLPPALIRYINELKPNVPM